jgi:ATP-dependent Clp protease ATP-binding subunit ClpA
MRSIGAALADVRTINKLFSTADRLARQGGMDVTGAEHLLRSALRLPDKSGERALARLGLTPDALDAAVAAVHSESLRSVGIDRDAVPTDDRVPITGMGAALFHQQSPESNEMFRRVVDRVRQDGAQLYGAYFLLDAAEESRGALGRALDRLNVTREELADAARAELVAQGSPIRATTWPIDPIP